MYAIVLYKGALNSRSLASTGSVAAL